MPDQMRLGRRSLATLIYRLNLHYTDAQIDLLVFKHGLDTRYTGQNKLSRLGAVFQPLVKEEADQTEVQNAIGLFEEVGQTFDDDRWDEGILPSLQEALRVDGLDLVGGRVVPFLSPSIAPQEEQGLLESRLSSNGFKVALNHFNQSVDNSVSGNWESANGDLRAFFECLCNDIAGKIHQGPQSPPTGGLARQYLTSAGFLDADESNLLQTLFRILHGQGAHPGTSSSDDCHRRRLMVVALSNYYLDKLSSWLSTSVV